MKTRPAILLLCALCCCAPRLQAQVNLVPNPSFEVYDTCPDGTNRVDWAVGWNNFGNTPDYLHACAPLFVNVPNAQGGFQYAHSGNAMVGVVTYVWQFAPDWPDYREFVGAQLLSPLNIGEKYYMSFFLNFSGYLQGWQKIGADKIGMKFSTVAFSELSPPPLNNFAHLYTDSIYIDTVQWYKISGSFVADSAYNYVILGNFFDSAQTDTIIFGGPPFGGSAAYYYIDDVCVTTDSLYNENWTGVKYKPSVKQSISVYPNPASDVFNIKSAEAIEQIELFNSFGQAIYKERISNSYRLEVTSADIPGGIYYIRLKTKDNYHTTVLTIIH